MRIPQAVLVVVTDRGVHLMSARTQPGSGPVPHPTQRLAAWPREQIDVAAEAESGGTRLTIAPEGGPRVVLYGPPDELTARVVDALAAGSTS
jgi:hypothetical protein